MTVKKRIITIRLSEKIKRNPEYAKKIGLDLKDKTLNKQGG